MNNPFGLPDEVFEAIITSALKGNPQPGNPPVRLLAQKGAETAKKIYDSYVAVGFSETQAFDLLKCVLTNKN
ncbi:hypothetical protein LJC58_08625 [Lachnospiraceae bacterium OttesenSCG-928-D06]|nr:hypothetical protein [Lachnospiraceae bacterium OttesenSCG-928-D06]